MTITIDLIEAFLKCPTKCFLRSRGETGAGNAYADWARAKSGSFRGEAIRRLVAEAAPEKCVANTPAIESLRQTQWQLAVDLTARIRNLQCSCHAVERMPSGGRGRAAQYVPIRSVFSNKLTRDDKLLLAFDSLVLPEMLTREVGLGKSIYGNNYSTQKVKTSALGDVRKSIEKIGVLLASSSPPDLVLNRHCVECEFQARCRQKAIEKDDLSLLGGMTEKERSDFGAKGIFTVTQLSYTFRPRRRPNGLRDKMESTIPR